jgi:histidine triad (HIT) family protein
MTLMAQKLAKEADLSESGYRIVMNTGKNAGQTVFHLHMHLLGGRPMDWPPG